MVDQKWKNKFKYSLEKALNEFDKIDFKFFDGYLFYEYVQRYNESFEQYLERVGVEYDSSFEEATNSVVLSDASCKISKSLYRDLYENLCKEVFSGESKDILVLDLSRKYQVPPSDVTILLHIMTMFDSLTPVDFINTDKGQDLIFRVEQ